jgi:hypothetical protein
MDDYEYCAEFAVERADGRPFRFLDYCRGAGKIVQALWSSGLEGEG